MQSDSKLSEVYASLGHRLRRIQREEYTANVACRHCGIIQSYHLPDLRCSSAVGSLEFQFSKIHTDEVTKLSKALHLLDELYDLMGWG